MREMMECGFSAQKLKMVSGGHNTDPIAPTSLIVPADATSIANPAKGQLALSGAASLAFYDGTGWNEVSGVNTGD